MDVLKIVEYIFYTLIFPGFLFIATVGLVLTYIERKITAHIQSRQGPIWFLQPFYDIGKLLYKKTIIPSGSTKIGFLLAPVIAIAGTIIAGILIFLQIFLKVGEFKGDLIVIFYLLVIPSLSLVLGGSSSRSPFGALGATRKMNLVIAYELPLLLAIITVIINSKSIMLQDVASVGIFSGNLHVSTILAFLVAIICMQAKLAFMPFDIPEAEQEIIGGVLAEYGGAPLALFKLTMSSLFFVLPVFLIVVFLGGIKLTFVGILYFLIKFLVIFAIIILIKVTNARLRLDQALDFFWKRVTPLAVASVILAIFGI